MTDEFLRACYDERNEIATEIAMLEDGQMVADSEEARVLRIPPGPAVLTGSIRSGFRPEANDHYRACGSSAFTT
jgi:hypothetical protein